MKRSTDQKLKTKERGASPARRRRDVLVLVLVLVLDARERTPSRTFQINPPTSHALALGNVLTLFRTEIAIAGYVANVDIRSLPR